jgi:hypothetical protein
MVASGVGLVETFGAEEKLVAKVAGAPNSANEISVIKIIALDFIRTSTFNRTKVEKSLN